MFIEHFFSICDTDTENVIEFSLSAWPDQGIVLGQPILPKIGKKNLAYIPKGILEESA